MHNESNIFLIWEHHKPIMIYGERFEFKYLCWDPKDGELCLCRIKSGENLMEVRNGSDVQIDR